ncbi:unnamed protein product [Leptosia nina]|uniref:Peptidase S1 domain-containing protein n=1 Tax=Leptosia nina TaxID=320188 RepID=A0AAV1J5U5_9NEOP
MDFVKFGIFLLFVTSKIKGEDYEEVDYDRDNLSASVDSESNEVFNSSSLSKPERIPKKYIVDNNHQKTLALKQVSLPSKSQMARKTSYPFSVSIQKKNSHYASGALLDTKWIITAAGDFYNVRESIKLLRARLGTVNYKKGGILVALKGIEVHPLYMYQEPNYDVALLRMSQPVLFSDHIKPIPIASTVGEIVSGKFFTTYWPRLLVNGRVLPASAKERVKHNSMRVSTQKLIPWRKCNKELKLHNQTLGQSSLCLEPIVTLHSPCMPDVGAPVIADNLLWGITSGWVSDQCTEQPSPTLFTRISDENVKFWLNSVRDV